MHPFRRPGGFFEIASHGDVFDAGELGRERMRLWRTFLHEGRGFLEVLHLWAEYPTFRAMVEQNRAPNRLQSISSAWHLWSSQSPDEAAAFIDAQSSHVWGTLDATAKATFLAITHALHHEGLLDEIQYLNEIRGKLSGIGTTFRLYCLLKSTAPAAVVAAFGRSSKSWNYFYEPQHPVCYRQSQSSPSLEISTREQATSLKREGVTVRGWEADIVIDYRESGLAHISPDNFDVTALSGSQSHYHLHELRYGGTISGLYQFRPQPTVGQREPDESAKVETTLFDSGVEPESPRSADESPVAEPSLGDPSDFLEQID